MEQNTLKFEEPSWSWS